MSVPAGPEVPMLTPIRPALARRIALGGMRAALLVADHVVLDPARLERLVERQDRGARNPEDDLDPFALEHADRRLHRCHLGHQRLLLVVLLAISVAPAWPGCWRSPMT